MSYTQIRQQVLAKIKPDPSIRKKALAQVATWNALTKEAIFVLGGSLAKDTHLKGTHDMDVFVRFTTTTKESLSDRLQGILQKLNINAQRVHGSRDYFQANINNTIVEFIPVKYVKSAKDIENVTDASVLHIEWFNAHANARLRDDDRLLKAFLQAQNVYGAESYIGGFSGHVVDILTIHHGGFLKALKGLSTCEFPCVIDPHKHYRTTKAALAALNEAKTQSPVVIIDPVDKRRNASASLTVEAAQIAKKASSAFVQKPTLSAFRKKKLSLSALQKKSGCTVVIRVKPTSGKKDIVGAKLKKGFERIHAFLVAQDYDVIETAWDWQEAGAVFAFRLKDRRRPKMKKYPGPKVSDAFHAERFLAAHKKVLKEGDRFVAHIVREPDVCKVITPFVKSLQGKYFLTSTMDKPL